jgi:transcriptional regulator with GAF, ATPase, and Fis domain
VERHRAFVVALLEPLSAALENGRRLRELSAVREAAEADKRSALSRLGREELIDTVVGADSGLAAVLERVSLVARSDIPVLILGETGAGKEVVARAIHERSAHASGPFIRVNCGAIPSELIDSELFGHERGAFTGAEAQRRGWFERADEGTLLLDEIGEMPPAAQVRLLRVLQEGTFERVGGEQPISVRVRVVAATHRDLPALVQAGRFREDLWYRIAGFPIVLPPLRERKQDIPALVEHFARRAAKRFGLRPRSPTIEDLALLTAYEWPGNVRELATVIDRAAILGDGEGLDVATALGTSQPGRARPERGAPGPMPSEIPVQPLAEAMRGHIETALIATRGRIEGARGAAALLRINPHTLRARMRKLGLDWSRFRD